MKLEKCLKKYEWLYWLMTIENNYDNKKHGYEELLYQEQNIAWITTRAFTVNKYYKILNAL